MKHILDLEVITVEQISVRYVLLKLTHPSPLPEIFPGQFVEVRVDSSPTTFLRRPISVNFLDKERNELWLLVAKVGSGTRSLASLKPGDTLNCILPLGKGFTMPRNFERMLLVGGGVGIAPLLLFGKLIKEIGATPTFLLGARTAADIPELDNFKALGRVMITTEDGSLGEKGFVTMHSCLKTENYDRIATCGPKPMMMAVADFARKNSIVCEASLENLMACGLGACLCCVEKTTKGNLCVCKEGPVFNIDSLLW